MPSILPGYRGHVRASLSLGSYLLLASSCPADKAAGTDASDSSSGSTTISGMTAEPITSTTGDPTTFTSLTTDPGTSSTGPAPAVCGDGVVAETEICDDGNDDPDDGCNKACEKTGVVEWTYTGAGGFGDVAIDPAGRIIVVGGEAGVMGDSDSLLVALGPDGTELWRKTFQGATGRYDGFTEVAVDADGNIYVGGYEGTSFEGSNAIVRAFDPDGGDLWTNSEPPPIDYSFPVTGLVVTADALYSVANEPIGGSRLLVRRHDLATGEAAWKAMAEDDTYGMWAEDLAVVGGNIIAVGYAMSDFNGPKYPLIAVFTDAGVLVSADIEDHQDGEWLDVAPIGPDGDLMLAGVRNDPRGTGWDGGVRRVGPDFSEQWTQILYHDLHSNTDDSARGVAVGPDEAIFVAGRTRTQDDDWIMFGARFAPDGSLLWTHTHESDLASGNAAAFGTDYVIIAGWSGESAWVRRLKAD